MKKVCALVFAIIIMLLSLTACGGGKPGTDSVLTASPWIALYSAGKITFQKDHTMNYGESTGTWAREDNLITITYTVSDGTVMEMLLDLTQNDNGTFLKKREFGKSNGTEIQWAADEYYPEEAAAAKKNELAKKPGDTVSTDIVDLTIEQASFTYYASSKVDQSWAAPLAEDSGGIFKTNKGRTFVALTFTVTNKDRNTIDIGETFQNGWDFSWKVLYKNASYNIKTFDLNNPDGNYGLSLSFSAISKDGRNTFSKYDSSNYLLKAGETITIRTLGLVTMEPEFLDDGFDLIVNVLNSQAKDELFIYSIV